MMNPATCPKCGADLDDWVDPEDTPEQLARTCAQQGRCTFVACDDLNCRAKADPSTLEEWRVAAEHWRTHRYMGGCSHGH